MVRQIKFNFNIQLKPDYLIAHEFLYYSSNARNPRCKGRAFQAPDCHHVDLTSITSPTFLTRRKTLSNKKCLKHVEYVCLTCHHRSEVDTEKKSYLIYKCELKLVLSGNQSQPKSFKNIPSDPSALFELENIRQSMG